MSKHNRLYWCRKLYGDVRKSGKIFFYHNRRCFFCYHYDGKQKMHYYARYKMEKKIGKMLNKKIHTHHKDGNTLNDKYYNLQLLNSSEHTIKTMTGRKHSEDSKNRIRYCALNRRKISTMTRMKMKKSSKLRWDRYYRERNQAIIDGTYKPKEYNICRGKLI